MDSVTRKQRIMELLLTLFFVFEQQKKCIISLKWKKKKNIFWGVVMIHHKLLPV